MSILKLDYLAEPLLRFGHDQCHDDPRSGLFLFGPLVDNRKPKQMRIGVIGTPEGISAYKNWVNQITKFIPAARADALHQVAFPGFEAAFATQWAPDPVVSLPISGADIARTIRIGDRHVAMYETVSLFIDPIQRKLRTDDIVVDLWFVVIPEEVYTFGRPMSRVPALERVLIERRINARIARRLQTQPSLFEEDMQEAKIYAYDLDFHDQLKTRLLNAKNVKAIAQVVRETSLNSEISDSRAARRMQDPATVAWNLSTTSFFKAGGRPWKLHAVRDRVCYVGIVFKVDPRDPAGHTACCGAQMFLDSGDGLVFKGALGAWYSAEKREFHLDESTAFNLLNSVIEEYRSIHGSMPEEIFLHSKTRFDDAEWRGFTSAADSKTNVIGVKINRNSDLKAYRPGKTPVLRGTALQIDRNKCYLWTSGFIPNLNTYAGREVPNPLQIEITHGTADLKQVMKDVMGLTKVNFNSCIYADGIPVTLRFADAVGEILIAGPQDDIPPLPFRHYI